MSVLDDYLVDPRLSLLDKTRIQAQVLVPVLRALRSEVGKEKADAIVKQALRDWSKQLFATIGDGIEGSPRRKWATMQSALNEVSAREVEFEILRSLMRSPGRVLSRRALLESVWDSADYREQRTIDVHIRHLREKLERDPSAPQLIRTVRGVGYRFGA